MENHTIKIVVANYHDHPVTFGCKNRIPLPVNQQEVMVEYTASNPAWSDDPQYIKSLFPKTFCVGIWKFRQSLSVTIHSTTTIRIL